MSKYNNIINKVSFMDKNELYKVYVQKKYADLADKYSARDEEESQKDEMTKQHERYVRNIKRRASGVDLEVKPTKAIAQKPGSYFYGPLKKLATDFNGDIKEMTRYMTLGQITKYQEKDNQLWNLKTGKIAFDSKTGEVFE